MSYWTHINGAIRFDMVRVFEVGKIKDYHFGNTCDFDDSKEVWDACDVPCGQEGSLQYKYVPYKNDDACITAGSLVIWGDLRGFEKEDQPKIIEWLNQCCTKYNDQGLCVRDGVVQINELIYAYEEEYDKEHNSSYKWVLRANTLEEPNEKLYI
jgi:hypothetical protein